MDESKKNKPKRFTRNVEHAEKACFSVLTKQQELYIIKADKEVNRYKDGLPIHKRLDNRLLFSWEGDYLAFMVKTKRFIITKITILSMYRISSTSFLQEMATVL